MANRLETESRTPSFVRRIRIPSLTTTPLAPTARNRANRVSWGVMVWQLCSNSTRVMIFCEPDEFLLTEIFPALNQNPRRTKSTSLSRVPSAHFFPVHFAAQGRGQGMDAADDDN